MLELTMHSFNKKPNPKASPAVGFYLGDANISMGGVAPYASRLSKVLSGVSFPSGLTLSIVNAVGFNNRRGHANTAIARCADAFCALTRRGPFELRSRRGLWTSKHFSKFDIIHIPYQSVPAGLGGKPYIITIHDVQELHFPQYFTCEERTWRAFGNYKAVRDAKAIVVSFDHVKSDIIRFFDCSEDKVFVAPLPLDACQLAKPSQAESLICKFRYSVFGDYILYPAQTWEHKNHLRLISAFEAARHRTGRDFSLVCTGHLSSFYSDHIEPKMRSSPFSDSIHFLGAVSETELRWLYENSKGVVIPTLYEAGSFPLIESMALGIPVVCSEVTSLPETIGDRNFVFKPTDVEAIARSISLIIEDESFRVANRRNGLSRFRELSNVDVAGFYESLWLQISSSL